MLQVRGPAVIVYEPLAEQIYQTDIASFFTAITRHAETAPLISACIPQPHPYLLYTISATGKRAPLIAVKQSVRGFRQQHPPVIQIIPALVFIPDGCRCADVCNAAEVRVHICRNTTHLTKSISPIGKTSGASSPSGTGYHASVSVPAGSPCTLAAGLEFVMIPAGKCCLGTGEPSTAQMDERPCAVTVKRPFLLQNTPVTQRQWSTVMGMNPSYFKSPDAPVECIDFQMAQNFIDTLNHTTRHGYRYRLPREAEWEYACRAGTSGTYFFGESPEELAHWALYRDNSAGRTAAVRQRPPNPWGLYDMLGNVQELCNERYSLHCSSPEKPAPALQYGNLVVTRGGGFNSRADHCVVRRAMPFRTNHSRPAQASVCGSPQTLPRISSRMIIDADLRPLPVMAIIPARGGSKGIARKALADLAGETLIARTIRYAHNITGLDKIVVSTDCRKIQQEARTHGAEAPFLRPADLANDTVGLTRVIRHTLDWYRREQQFIPRIVIVLYCTSPFRRPGLIDVAIRWGLEDGKIYSISAFTPIAYPLESIIYRNTRQPLVFTDDATGDYFAHNGSFSVIFPGRDAVDEQGVLADFVRRVGIELTGIETLEIDEPDDLAQARALIAGGDDILNPVHWGDTSVTYLPPQFHPGPALHASAWAHKTSHTTTIDSQAS